MGALAGDHCVARSRATSCTTLLATRGALRVALIAATPDARAVARSMGPSPAACGPPGRWKMASGCWLAAARTAILAPLAGYRDGKTGVDAAARSVATEPEGDAPHGAENWLRGAPQVACLDIQLVQRGTLQAAAGARRAAGPAGPAAPHRAPPSCSPTKSTPPGASTQPSSPPREVISTMHISAPTTWDGMGRRRKYVYTPHPNWGYQRAHGRGHSLWRQPGSDP